MNWYFLIAYPVIHQLYSNMVNPVASTAAEPADRNSDSRDHLLEASERRFDIVSCRNVILDLIDERRIGNSSWVGGRILTICMSVNFEPARS